LDRIGEVAVILLVGIMISVTGVPSVALWFVPLLLLIIRPAAAGLSMVRSTATPVQRAFIAWFGIRGIGSIYYLMYAIEHGLTGSSAQLLTSLTLAVIAASVIVHGVSVTPLMGRYSDSSTAQGVRAHRHPGGSAQKEYDRLEGRHVKNEAAT
jgi:NhaP-type Na+/H+ or K+/H+ antiporter